jgi:hypothetical protein
MSFTPSTYPLVFNNLPIQVSDPDVPANQATLLNTLQLNSAGHSTELTSTGILSDETTTTWSSIGSSASNTVALVAPPDSTTINVINKVIVEDTANLPTKNKIVLDASINGYDGPIISTTYNNLENESLTLSMQSFSNNLTISSSSNVLGRAMQYFHYGVKYMNVNYFGSTAVIDLASETGFTSLNIGNSACAVDASTALSFALPNNSTASTQSQADNSTKVATTAYVDTAISNLNLIPTPVFLNASFTRSAAETNVLYVDITDLVVGKYYSINVNGLFNTSTAFSMGSLQVSLVDANEGSPNVINGIQYIDPRNSFITSAGYKWTENVSGVFEATATTAYVGFGYTSAGGSVGITLSYNISIVQI